MDTKDAGRKGGLSISNKKAEAARKNGKKGGRPVHGGHTWGVAGCQKCKQYLKTNTN